MLDPADCDTSLCLLALFDPEDDATRKRLPGLPGSEDYDKL